MHIDTVIAHAVMTGFSVRSTIAISARLRDNTLAQYNNMVTFKTSEG
jgi:preprotein translocase subunit SecF